MTINTYKPNDTARIEAMLFEDKEDCLSSAQEWAGIDLQMRIVAVDNIGFDEWRWQVKTLEGWVDMPYGSYLCKGTSGGFYPCDSDEFAKRWVQVWEVHDGD